MRIFALTFGGLDAASSYYRLFQFEEFLQQAGVQFEWSLAKNFSDFQRLRQYDVVILQKALLSASSARKIRSHSKRLIYDVDDLIWLRPGKPYHWWTRIRLDWRLQAILRSADLCIAANSVIASELLRRRGRVSVVPMALNGRKWQDVQRTSTLPTIGWSGSPKTLPFLKAILPQLKEVQIRFPQIRWLFHCGQNPAFENFRCTHLPYHQNQEPQAVRQFDIGLIPLPDDPFTRGKSPIKALQYFASGVATIGSPVGATREILEENKNALWAPGPKQWIDAMAHLILDAPARTRLASAARKCFEKRYEARPVFEQLIKAWIEK